MAKDRHGDKQRDARVTAQLTAVALTIVWSVVATAIIAYIVKALVGLRPTDEVEINGLDLAEHGEEGYHG
jgi:Amt family ammonium transporter